MLGVLLFGGLYPQTPTKVAELIPIKINIRDMAFSFFIVTLFWGIQPAEPRQAAFILVVF